MPNVFEVRFEQVAQPATPGRFSIPKSVAEILGVGNGSTVFVEVTSHRGVMLKQRKLKSGTEIYGDFDGHFDLGEQIVVRITRIGASA